MTTSKNILTRISAYRCAMLFFSLVLFLILLPFLESSARGRIVGNLLNVIIMITAITAMGRSRFSLPTALLLALPAFVLQVAAIGFDEPRYLVLSWGFGAVVYVVALVSLLRHIFSPAAMTADKLYGAAAAYLLIGVLWAYLYAILQHVYPGSFTVVGTPVAAAALGDLLYFSFTTFTTTGFGDIVPVLRHAQMLVILEQVTGVLFVAILIARLAGMYHPGREGGE
jgi:hypothetical protein